MLTRRSVILLGVAAALGAANLLSTDPATRPGAELPTLPGIDRDTVTRVEIRKGQLEKVVIEGSLTEGWQVLEPYQAPADTLIVRTLLNRFTDPIPMDLRVDEGELDTYGVDDNNGVLVELFTDSVTPALSMVVGGDMPGGSSFVRLPDSDTVYRARVGNRSRYGMDPGGWRNHLVVHQPPEWVSAIDLQVAELSLRIERSPTGAQAKDGSPELGPWTLPEHPDFDLDQILVKELTESMSTVRASRILSAGSDGGFDQPVAQLDLTLTDGSEQQLTFGGRQARGAAYLKLGDRDEVFLVASAKLQRVPVQLEQLRNRSVFTLQREDIATLTLRDREGRVLLTQLPDGMWEVTEPINVDADVKPILFAANTMAQLRSEGIAEGVSLEDAGLITPPMKVDLTLKTGQVLTLEVGKEIIDPQGRSRRLARRSDSDLVYVLSLDTLIRIRQGFGRAQ